MGSQAEMQRMERGPTSHTKATFSGMTAFIGVLSLLITIISVATPHWGSYSPIGQSFYSAGLPSQDNTGHFGPFQVCKYHGYYSFCGSQQTYYKPSTWLLIGGICAIVTVGALSFFCLFAILHVAMQLQRRVIWISFQTDLFLKLVSSAIAVLSNIGAVIFGGIEFSISGRTNFLQYKIGVCYYLLIFLIFVNLLLVILSYLSYKRARRYPLNLVPKGRANDYVYDHHNSNGVSMTASSGQPYTGHGTPRLPIQPNQPPNPSLRSAHAYTANAISSYANGHTLPTVHFTTASQPGPQVENGNNGFSSVQLQPPTNGGPSSSSPQNMASGVQPLPIQPIRPIQPSGANPQGWTTPSVIPPSPQPVTLSHLPQVLPTGSSGVSFTPQGRGYAKMDNHSGSVESLSTLSTYSFGSTISSSGSAGPLRSSLKKPKNKDNASVSSKTSSKQVRISLGQEQTQV